MKKSVFLAVCIAVLFQFAACGSKFSGIPESSTNASQTNGEVSATSAPSANAETAASLSSIPTLATPDFSSYLGLWYTPEGLYGDTNSSSEDVLTNGGILLNITNADDGKVGMTIDYETAAEVIGYSVWRETELDSGGTTKFIARDGMGNKANMTVSLKDGSVTLSVQLQERNNETWQFPEPGMTYEFVKETTVNPNIVESLSRIDNPEGYNYRQYLAQFGLTEEQEFRAIDINNWLVKNKLTDSENTLKEKYDIPNEVKFINEIVPEDGVISSDGGEVSAEATQAPENGAQHYKELLARRAQLKEEYAKKAKAFFDEHYGVLAAKDYYMYSNMFDPKQIAEYKKEEGVEDVVFPYEETLALVPWGPDSTCGVRILDQSEKDGSLVICLRCSACGDEVSVDETVRYKRDYNATRTCKNCGAQQEVYIKWKPDFPPPDLSR